MNLADYSQFCGPRALRAVLDTPTSAPLGSACARRLLEVQHERGVIEAPSTSIETMTIALDRFGYAVEPHDPIHAGPLATPDAFLAACRASVPTVPLPLGAANEIIGLAPIEQQPKLWAQHLGRYPDHARLSAWLPAAGTWLFVACEVDAHWLASRDGVVISGDDEHASNWGKRPLRDILRIWRR
jgi:hypothetical protein